MRVEFERQGVDKMLRILVSAPGVAAKALGSALGNEAEDIMAESVNVYAPFDLGTLTGNKSAFVDNPVVKGNKVSVEMGYGGDAAAYALAIHEHPSRHSPPSWEGKEIHWRRAGSGPKYLEKPVLAAEKGFGRRIGADIEAAFKRGFR